MSRAQTYVIVLLSLGVCIVVAAVAALLFIPISAPQPSSEALGARTTPAQQPAVSPAPTNTSVLVRLSSPTPKGMRTLAPLATVVPTPGLSSINRCGNYNLTQQVGQSSAGHVATVTVSNAQGQVFKTFKADAAASAAVQVLWCADITGTGTPDLVVQTYSGGGRCCSTYDIISMAENFPVHLHWEAGNGAIDQVVMLSGRLPYEMVGADDRLVNFDSQPFAVPPFLPVVFAFRSGKYVAATRDYPLVLRDDQTKAQQALAKCADESCQKALALKIYAEGVWLNEDAQTFTRVKSQVKPSIAAWLDSVRANALKVLSK